MDILAQAARALSLLGPAASAPVAAASMEQSSSTALKMQVYPAAGGHIAKLVLPTSAAPGGAPMMAATSSASHKKQQPVAAAGNAVVPLYVILDRSGSMGANVGRLVQQVLPDMLAQIDHPANEPICVIAFDSSADTLMATAAQLKANKSLNARGGTYMATAIDALIAHVSKQAQSANKADTGSPLRILTLTDGELGDQEVSLAAAGRLRSLLEGRQVNSQAVRIFTSSSQPDTRGLTGMMQISNSRTATLLDIDMYRNTMPMIAGMLAALFKDDGLGNQTMLESSEPAMLPAPWKPAVKALSLRPGENIFWLKDLPQLQPSVANGTAGAASSSSASIPSSPVTFKIGSDRIEVEIMPALNEDSYQSLLKSKIDFFLSQCKVLRVLNTASAQEEIQQILSYWSALDRSMAVSEVDIKKLLSSSKGLRDRLTYFRAATLRSNRSVSARMAQIANDERISQLNSAQAAEYLRSADAGNSNSKGLARRALGNGLDFDVVARAEVRAMAAHLDELKDIDDGDHTVSFYSQETTLGGIRATASLIQDDLVEEMSVNDIMRMLNIVGVAANAPVGDYPDAMTYRLNEIYPGCYVSLADVLTAYVVSKGQALEVPGQATKTIVNVVPFYDDERIHKFLRKYAPKMLEYIASVGMRRMVAEVSMTMSYTLVAGVWKLVEDLNTNRSELTVSCFVKMARAYNLAIGGYFDHVMPHMNVQPGMSANPKLSFCLGKNGVTNMISPLMRILNDGSKAQFIAPILRALYSFEVWQIVRKSFRHQENSHLVIEGALVQMLSIDVNRDRTPMTALFEPNAANPVWHDGYVVNVEAVKKAMAKCWFVNYLTLLPALLGPASANCTVAEAVAQIQKSAPTLSDEFVCKQLGLADGYSLADFQMFNIAQALLLPQASDRFDDATQTTAAKFIDLGDRAAADASVRAVVRKMFEARWASDCSTKSKEERRALVAELVARICSSQSADNTIQLLRTGLTRGTQTVCIANTSSQGFMELKTALLDLATPVPRRAEAIELFVMARDAAGEPIWNNGNVLFVESMEPFRLAFLAAAHASNDPATIAEAAAKWTALNDAYQLRKRHTYRADPNRHGHSNDKPSYWALGYALLEDMVAALSAEEWAAYKRLHSDCCGVPALGELLQVGSAVQALAMPASASSSSAAPKAAKSAAAEKAAKNAAKQAVKQEALKKAAQAKKQLIKAQGGKAAVKAKK